MSTPLVAIHGFSDSGACMRALLVRLGLTDATAPNLLAHGGRAMPSGSAFSHDNLVDDVIVAVSQAVEKAGEPVALYGHSLGASTAAGVAARAPDLVRTLMLEDPPWQVPTSADADSEQDLAADEANGHRPWLEGLQSTDHAGRLGWLRENNPGWPAAEHDPWAQAKAQVDLALFDAPQQWLRRSWGRVAHQVQCPTLLMVGEPALGAASEPGVADTLERMPGWTVRRITGAGHNLRRERPDLVADLVQSALAEAG